MQHAQPPTKFHLVSTSELDNGVAIKMALDGLPSLQAAPLNTYLFISSIVCAPVSLIKSIASAHSNITILLQCSSPYDSNKNQDNWTIIQHLTMIKLGTADL